MAFCARVDCYTSTIAFRLAAAVTNFSLFSYKSFFQSSNKFRFRKKATQNYYGNWCEGAYSSSEKNLFVMSSKMVFFVLCSKANSSLVFSIMNE